MKEYKTTIPEITLKYKSGDVKKVKVCSSSDGYDLLKEFYDQDTLELTESVIALFFNRANNCIGWMKTSSGGLDQCVMDIRVIMATALKSASSGIIVSHNHPSGNLRPSEADNKITDKLNQGCKIFDIKLMDHIIVTEASYYSYADEGKL